MPVEAESYRIGIDLGGTKIAGIVLDSSGNELARERIATPKGSYEGTLAGIKSVIAQLENKAAIEPGAASVGIATPGALSLTSGLMKNCNSTWLNGKPLDRDLALALRRPVRLANDANCLAVSEATDGAGAGAHVVFAVILGTGCGGGIAIDGKPLTGRNAIAGEWGHNPLPWATPDEYSGPPCYCGKRGCNETWLSGTGIAADHLAVTGIALDTGQIAEAAAAGEAAALATLARHSHRLARALATVINVIDPDIVVIGGGVSRIESLYASLPDLLSEWCFSDGVSVPVRPALHGDDSGVRGAAWLWEQAR